MAPTRRLPLPDGFDSEDAFVESLLHFTSSSDLFRALVGGVHILDLFTEDPSFFDTVIPAEWRGWLRAVDEMRFLDLLLREDLAAPDLAARYDQPPASLLDYIRQVRMHSLKRGFTPRTLKQAKLPRHLRVGMIPKKVHEVLNFAGYVNDLADEIEADTGRPITHFVDYGSGQNYLGRSLASPPYNKNIVAVESKENNIIGAKQMDVLAGVAEREKVMRNKKLWRQLTDQSTPQEQLKTKAVQRMNRAKETIPSDGWDLRPIRELETIYTPEAGKGGVQYVENLLQDGDLSDVVEQLQDVARADDSGSAPPKPSLMAVSIHSCGNLSHHGLRSLILNPEVQAVAIVGCCYNLLTERLGPANYKHPSLQSLQPLNHRVQRESAAFDPHGFPMSARLAQHGGGGGVRLNITARMMAVQAPRNWTAAESDSFFTRHFFRALLQKVFYDRGVVSKPFAGGGGADASPHTPHLSSRTDPIIIGSLRKACYASFDAYVQGAVAKLRASPSRGPVIATAMDGMTPDEMRGYAAAFAPRKKEVSALWTLMAFSAEVAESLIVVDRWLFLREEHAAVRDCWVEAVFDYQQSPRNLVVVGVKR